MFQLGIKFENAWYLLLLIPAIALTLIPYFRLVKRYRRNRNRITSMILHMIVMVLAIAVLAGTIFTYEYPNYQNEIILLVDCSDTERESQEARDSFVESVLESSRYDNFTVGVVTFGFDQVYAVPLTTDIDSIYEQYLNAQMPDTSATNIASALLYAQSLFNNPETGKIVLITDGKETDERAENAIRMILAQGIRVDSAYIESNYSGSDIQINDIIFPDYHINSGDECDITVTLQSNAAIPSCTLGLLDNNAESATATATVDLSEGLTTVTLKHTFETDGLHVLKVTADAGLENLSENNSYFTYFSIETFNKILILERYEESSNVLKETLLQDDRYNVDVHGETIKILNVMRDALPEDISDLLAYDQIILNNISNEDLELHVGFVDLLYSYVHDFGGGLFTVGGNDESGEAHAYDRSDMYGTKYQEMLPVQAINYTPPAGVVVIIDVSGSMTSTLGDGKKIYEWALAGAKSSLNALTERDYFGIMTMSDSYTSVLQLTSCSQKDDIIDAIDNINIDSGGTKVAAAHRRAVQALISEQRIDKRHVIFFTDYQLPKDNRELFESQIKAFYESHGITLSVVGINLTDTVVDQALYAAEELGHGRLMALTSGNIEEITVQMREDLMSDSIKEVVQEEFYPIVDNPLAAILKDVELGQDDLAGRLTFKVGGFYGVKPRANAEVFLTGEYGVPLYAQWKFGKGTVGSFMSDLNGNWSQEMLSDLNGKQILYNIVANIMPLENVRFKDVNYVLEEDNYTNHLSIYSTLLDGQYINGQVSYLPGDADPELLFSLNALPDENFDRFSSRGYTTLALDSANNYSRSSFVLKEPGIYRINLKTYNADESLAGEVILYRAVPFSEEYLVNMNPEELDYAAFVQMLAETTNGTYIEDLDDPAAITADFTTSLEDEFDPRYLFMILAIILMLLDIAVRKFKFKWPHEIIRARKEKKAKEQVKA